MIADKKIRWAILGAGKIARKFVQDFSLTIGGELVGVASAEMERAKLFAKEFSLARAFSYEDLYAANNIDVVYIATTHNGHYKHSLSCLQRDKAVLCEKPFTINLKECIELQGLAKNRNIFLMEALWTYFLPAVQKARDWIKQQKIGRLKAIQANFGFAMPYNASGRLYNPLLGGGALLDLGIYPIAICSYFTDMFPSAIKASAVFTSTGVDETTSILLNYDGGISAVLYTSLNVKTINSAFLYGEKGFIEIADFFKASKATLYDEDNNLIELFEDKRPGFGYQYEIQHVTNCLLSGKKQSDVATPIISRYNQDIMGEIRNQIGLVYPMEIRK
ncbi:MAG: Gfo/Idh/MocA family oxidoreductase [Flavisolibacter sp.]